MINVGQQALKGEKRGKSLARVWGDTQTLPIVQILPTSLRQYPIQAVI